MSVTCDQMIKASVCFDSMQDNRKRQRERVLFCIVVVLFLFFKTTFHYITYIVQSSYSLDWLHAHGIFLHRFLSAGDIGINNHAQSDLWGFFLLLSFLYCCFLIHILKIVSAHIEVHPTCHNYLCSCFPS